MRGSEVIAPTPDPNLSKTLTSLSIIPKRKILLHTHMKQLLNTKVRDNKKEMNLPKTKNKKK